MLVGEYPPSQNGEAVGSAGFRPADIARRKLSAVAVDTPSPRPHDPLRTTLSPGEFMPEKSVADKLLLKPNTTVWLSDPARRDLIGSLPAGVLVADSLEGATAGIVVVDDAASLRATLDAHEQHLMKPSIFWVLYPKGNRTDINRDTLWPLLTQHGMRPIGQVAVDDEWSALRFRALKEGEPPFTGGR